MPLIVGCAITAMVTSVCVCVCVCVCKFSMYMYMYILRVCKPTKVNR